jgi:hypothetical protein
MAEEYNVVNDALKKAVEVGAIVLIVVVAVAAIQTVVGGNFIDLVALI